MLAKEAVVEVFEPVDVSWRGIWQDITEQSETAGEIRRFIGGTRIVEVLAGEPLLRTY